MATAPLRFPSPDAHLSLYPGGIISPFAFWSWLPERNQLFE